ncbi:Craniofacial development protein 2 [Blattella germanica]|nr:Craniofacial development protein 2 [Blattella germanica]
MIIGTWNVKTLLKPGKLQELKEQIKNTTIDIVAVQETRWTDVGMIKKKDFTFYYGGPKTRTGQAGTGFLIKQKMVKHVIAFNTINERISKLRIRGKFNNITLINVYAPTEECQDNIKDQFYDNLQYVVDHIQRSDKVLTLGDLNAKLGK